MGFRQINPSRKLPKSGNLLKINGAMIISSLP